MKFELKCNIDKLLWDNGSSFMYKAVDIESEKNKLWTFFCRESLMIGSSYKISGYVSESKDKKTKDQNGRDIWKANFNAEEVILIEDNQIEETPFLENEELPF